jgi:hypothetical protein
VSEFTPNNPSTGGLTHTSPPAASLGILCTAAAVVVVLGSNLIDIGRFHDSLSKMRTQQQINIEAVGKAENQLDALAKGTKALADAGNPNARAILEVLRQNGVQVNAAAPSQQQ